MLQLEVMASEELYGQCELHSSYASREWNSVPPDYREPGLYYSKASVFLHLICHCHLATAIENFLNQFLHKALCSLEGKCQNPLTPLL